ncbi:MAG TPA: hypothetical protein DCZ91_21565 [Lachnospiraceae bacterium]|nr:hypothetical protein [Lachnospiraceae bacterium]
MKKEDKQQFTLRISQANPTELVVILYEMLLCYLEDAKEALQPREGSLGDQERFHGAVRNARGCLNELLCSLDLKYEPAPTLQRLYMFCIRRLARGEQRLDAGLLDEIKRVIVPLCDAYRELAKQNSTGPVMKNSQTVIAGLTYGRNTLTENLADQGRSRGILA